MGANGDIYEVVLHSTMEGQACVNVFNYVATGATPQAQQLALAFSTTIVPEIAKIAVDNVAYTAVYVYNLNAPLTDFYDLPIADNGNINEDRAPRFVAWGFTYKGQTKVTRAGAKRFVGCGEASMSGSNPVATMIPILDALAAILETPFEDANLVSYAPAIVRKSGTASAGYVIEALNMVSEVVFARVTTQNSRKN